MRRFDEIVEAVYGHLTKVHEIKDVESWLSVANMTSAG